MQLVQTVAPTQKPITLEEAKAFLRVTDTADDATINLLIGAVTDHVENVTNRQLNTATYELYSNNLITKLPKNPIQSLSKIEYMDVDGSYVELDDTTYYLYENNGVALINYSEFPSIYVHEKAIKITCVSGYVKVPDAIKSYMNVTISTLYENREKFFVGASIAEFSNEFIENMLSSYRVRSF